MENKRWSGLWSEPQDDNSIYGVKLIEDPERLEKVAVYTDGITIFVEDKA